jgi:hypothetical protein
MDMKPDFDRSTVLQILESAFNRAAEVDYRDAHIHIEEDVRAATYRYIRNALDLAPNWKVLVNPTAFGSAGESAEMFKPDLVFFHWPPGYPNPRVEVFVEIKHWPNKESVEHDLKKLERLKSCFREDDPAVAFFAILGNGFDRASADLLCDEMTARFKAHVWFVPHWSSEWGEGESLYKGPFWDAVGCDPWRARLKHRTENG